MFNINALFLLVVLIKTQTNLICNGDFQVYATPTLYNGSLNNTEYSGYAQTSASCWIRQSLAVAGSLITSLQIKLITKPAWPVNSKVVDTVSYDRYGICQNLTLIKSQKYTLKYNLVLDASNLDTTFTTYINSVPIVTKIYNKTYTVYTEIFTFTANASSNLICLQPDLINYNLSFLYLFPSYRYGPAIDNISLYLSSQLVNSANSTINSTNLTTNSTTNLISNSTMNSSTNFTVNSTNFTIADSNSTINSNNSVPNSVPNSTVNSTSNSTMNFPTNSSTNLTENSNSTLNFTNSSTNFSIIQNLTNNSSVNQSTQHSPSNITSNSTTNVQNMSVNTQNVTTSNSSFNTSNSDNSSSINNSSGSTNNTNNMTGNFNSSSNSSENSTFDNSSVNNIIPTNKTEYNSTIIAPNSTLIIPNITTPIPPIMPPTIPTFKRTDTEIIVHFKSEISSLSENIIIVSDLKPSQYGIPIIAFSTLKVQIQQTVQTNLIYYADKNGYLVVQFLPESYYDEDTLSGTLKIYLPQIPLQICSYKFTVIVDGKTINLVVLTQNQKNMMESAITAMQTISKGIQKSFLVINSVSCSYFLISLIGFYNLSLMYIFLNIKTLPNFSRVFLNTLAYVFFSKGSITEFIKEIFHIQEQINFFDFPIEEKMQSHEGQFLWFGAFGNSSNFMLNNFESLVLLGLLLIKFLILKLILIKILPEKLKLQLDIKPFKFYQHFLGELSCFIPFFVVSSTECIIEMGESNWDGQLNNLVQILVFFLFSIMAIIGFSLAYLRENRKLLSLKKFQNSIKSQKLVAQKQKHISRKCSTLQKYSYFLLCFLIPFVIIIGSSIIFFILITPITVWRFYSSIKNLHRKKSLQNAFKMMNKIVWMVYHFGFLLLFVLQLLQIDASKKMLDFMKYIGFILIFCVLIGAFIDILQALISVIMALVEFIKICIKSCKNKVSPCSQNSQIDIKKTEQATQNGKQKEKQKKIGETQCLKLKIEQIQTLQNEVNKKITASLAQLQKTVKAKTSKIKNASINRNATDKRLKIKQLQ